MAAAAFFFWVVVFVGFMFSDVPMDEDNLEGPIAIITILIYVGLTWWASRTLRIHGVIGPPWSILLPLVVSIAWAVLALFVKLDTSFITTAPFTWLAVLLSWSFVTGLTIPIGIGCGIAHLILRLSSAGRRGANGTQP